MKKIFLSIIAIIIVASSVTAHNPKEWRKLKQNVNFIVASDLDRRGCYDQQVIAKLMGEMAKRVKPEAVIVTGDAHHGNGVKSAYDDDWKERFEDIYTHPKLKIDWYSTLGNHEHRGNIQGVIDYSKVNPYWNMPAPYYTKVFKKSGVSIRFVVLDTPSLIEKYRESSKYANAGREDMSVQLEWLQSVLNEAKEDWVVVIGHHPIHADTKKSKSERTDMRKNVDSILRKHNNVAMYICGHIHNFQHLRDKGSKIDYIVNASASEGRSVKYTKRTKYCSPSTGFSVIAAGKKSLMLHMIDKNGNVLHTVKKTK
ncbi:MAG: metallophosphoesterase [Alistipes sp.]|nr:metallophosphoesterase [Alistipes sp.]